MRGDVWRLANHTAFGIDAATDGPMVALLGDLATLHDLGGFAAAARLGRGGTIIVLNNGGIGKGIAEFPTDGPLPPGVLTIGARYDLMMEAFGGKGFFVEDPKDLAGALEQAKAHDGPALVNVVLHPEAGRKPQQFGWLTT